MNWIKSWIQKLRATDEVTDERFNLILSELKSSNEDIRPSDVVDYSEPLRSALNLAVRNGLMSLTELKDELQVEREQALKVADLLVARQLFKVSSISTKDETYYETRLSAMTRPMKRPPVIP
jgi:hypothetical protein